jgi:hypothetical protein
VAIVVTLGLVGTGYILWRVPTKETELARRAEVSAGLG